MKVRAGRVSHVRTDRPWTPRSFTIIGHRSSGKTSVGELILAAARVVRQAGSVDEGTSLLDWSDEEHRRQQTMTLSAAWLEHDDQPLQMIDTPGAAYLSHLRDQALALCDTALVVLDGGEGLTQGAADAVAAALGDGHRPTVAVVSKLERVVDLEGLVGDLEAAVADHRPGARVVPMGLPFHGPRPWQGPADPSDPGGLQGLVDLLAGQVLRYADDESGKHSPEPVPDHLASEVAAGWERICEAVALTDDVLLEQYLEDLELPREAALEGLARAVGSGRIVPVLLTSAPRHIGAAPLLDALVRWMPSPACPEVRTFDGEVRPATPEDGFLGQIVARQWDRQGDPFAIVRVWNGSPPRTPWRAVHPFGGSNAHGGGSDGRSGGSASSWRVNKLYRVRGPRRATAPLVGPGALVAVWDPAALSPGTTVTAGADLEVMGPRPAVPTVARWIHPVDPRDPDRPAVAWDEVLAAAVAEVVRCDGGLALRREPGRGVDDEDLRILVGQSEAHVDLAVDRVHDRCGIRLRMRLPPVAYREIPTGAAEHVAGIHQRVGASGLVSEYASCVVSVSGGPRGDPPDDADHLRFVDTLPADDDTLPARFRPAIVDGARRALLGGPTGGFPVVGVEVHLVGGDYDMLQSTDEHFRIAGEKAVRGALAAAGTGLLEPWSEIEVEVPHGDLGMVISDIAAHRGRIVGMAVSGALAQVKARCPVRELRTFSTRLDDLCAGRGRFWVTSDEPTYAAVSAPLAAEILDALGADR